MQMHFLLILFCKLQCLKRIIDEWTKVQKSWMKKIIRNIEWLMNERSRQIRTQTKILLNGKMQAFTAGEVFTL